jgi:hypothetical protein
LLDGPGHSIRQDRKVVSERHEVDPDFSSN